MPHLCTRKLGAEIKASPKNQTPPSLQINQDKLPKQGGRMRMCCRVSFQEEPFSSSSVAKAQDMRAPSKGHLEQFHHADPEL